MTREEYLQWCNTCAYKALDAYGEVVCSFSGRMADFNGTCPSYKNVENGAAESSAAETSDQAPQMSPEQAAAAKREAAIRKKDALVAKMEGEQNLLNGILASTLAGLAGAAVWAFITVATGYQLAILAIGLGALVGVAMRYFGKGLSLKYGIIGGAVALISVILGNYFSVIGMLSSQTGVGFFAVLGEIPLSAIPEVLAETFDIIDLLFYGLAVAQGFKYSIIQVPVE